MALRTPKWKQCVDMVVRGMSPKEIAFELKLSIKTVEYHLAIAKKKMGIRGWGQTPFLMAVIDRKQLDAASKRLAKLEEHVKLALDILLELRGH